MKKVLKIVGIVVAVVVVLGIAIVVWAMSSVDYKKAYMESCTKSAASYSSVISETDIQNYCGCVYDDLIAKYGEKTFIKYAKEYSEGKRSLDFSNDSITKCVSNINIKMPGTTTAQPTTKPAAK